MKPVSSTSTNRWLSIDLLRGYFLLVIIIDHVGHFPNVYELLTGRGLLWVTAAEGFFFLSGMMVGLTRARKVKTQGFTVIWKKLWQRSALLYFWAVSLTLLFTGWAINLGNLPKGGLTESRQWLDIVTQSVTLSYGYGWSDFLSHYALYMLVSPLAVYALVKGKYWLVILGSVFAWALGGSSFNLSWQILFFGGMVAGFYLPEIQHAVSHIRPETQQRLWRLMLGATITTVAISTMVMLGPTVMDANHQLFHGLFESLGDINLADSIPWWLNHINQLTGPVFDHHSLGVGRVLLFGLWFSTIFILFQKYQHWIQHYFGGLLLPMGQHSLETYIIHAIVLFGIDSVVWAEMGPTVSFIRTSATITIVWVSVAKILPWLHQQWHSMRNNVSSIADELQANPGPSAIKIGSLSIYLTPAVAMVLIRAIRDIH